MHGPPNSAADNGSRRVLVDEDEQRAVQLVHEHTDETRLAVEQEQARIAQERHDISCTRPGSGGCRVTSKARPAPCPDRPGTADGTAGPADRPRQPSTASRRRANAYRIVQEALTNTLKRAGAARTTVLWSWGSATTATGQPTSAPAGTPAASRRSPPMVRRCSTTSATGSSCCATRESGCRGRGRCDVGQRERL